MLPYLGAIALVVAAVLFRTAVDPVLKNRQPFAAFIVAVLIAARYCGFKPSLLAVFLSALASRYFFVPPRGSLLVASFVEEASCWFFVAMGILISLVMRSERRASEEARRQADLAVAKQQELEREIVERERVEALLRDLIQAQENKNRLLCNEVHDGLIQYAVGSLMSLEGFRRNRPETEDLSAVDMAIDNLRRGVDDGRRAIRGIRPAVLDSESLEAAINDLAEQFANSGIAVTSVCDPQIGRLPDVIQTAVYRVVQEALNNAQKHSGADAIEIDLNQANGDLHLQVRDSGRGFDVSSAHKSGFGLVGMTERVRLLGGECHIESQPNAGTRISVRLPIGHLGTCTG
jgi:signal transduction histidine kinase